MATMLMLAGLLLPTACLGMAAPPPAHAAAAAAKEGWSLISRMPTARHRPSRRRDRHFAGTPSPTELKHLLEGEGGAAE